jgi:hypothetical protein
MWRTKRIGEGSLYRSVRQSHNDDIFHPPPLPPLPFFFFLLLPLCWGPHRSSGHDAHITYQYRRPPDHNYQGDGIGWLSFAGEINVDSDVTIGGFKAAALWVKVRTQIPSSLFLFFFFFKADTPHRIASFSHLRPPMRTRAQLVIRAALFLFGW